MLIQLRPYQQDIVNQAIESNEATLIQIPTGGGKTVIAREIIMELINHYNKQILFVAPKIVLMEQTMEVFKGLKPHIVHGTSKYSSKHHLLVSTIQTASRRDNLNPDVIIIDEIHYGFEGIMIEKLIKDKPNTRVIGLSATPYDKNGRLLNGFDLVLDKYDMKYMIKHKFLVPLKSYVLTKPNLDNVKIIAGDYDLKDLGEVVCDKNTIMEIVETTKSFIEKSKKTIVFAVDIEHAELLTKAYSATGFNVKTLHSRMSKEDIKKEIHSFREGYNNVKILVSVLMLTTGFDVPDTDCAVIARPTRSQNLYKQMVGRILRTADDKKFAVLLDCGNVIENLGMPLEPVKIIDGNEIVNKLRCNICESENLKLVKKDNNLYWECKDCGFLKEIEQGSYECDSCHQLHSIESDFSLENDKLYLNCDCGHKTIISEYQGQEELILVEDIEQDDKSLTFEEAREYARNLELKSEEDWINHYKNCYPYYSSATEPKKIYENEWTNWSDWLGINLQSNNDEKDIREKIENVIKSSIENINETVEKHIFKQNHNREELVLLRQNTVSQLIDLKIKYLSRRKKNDFNLNLFDMFKEDIEKISDEFKKLLQDTLTIKDIENTKSKKKTNIKVTDYLSFEEAREFARNLKLRTTADWKKYCKGKMPELPVKPDNIPTQPEQTYFRLGWVNYKDWLNKGLKPFEEAKEFVKKLNIKNVKEWNKYCKGELEGYEPKPNDIPRDPDLRYRKEWINWEDWLKGNTNKIFGEWRDFNEAREFVRSLNIQNTLDWKKYCKGELDGYQPKPDDIPAGADYAYRDDGWIDYGDWLGTFRKKFGVEKEDNYLPFEEAREFARSLKLKTPQDWRDYVNGLFPNLPKLPQDIPSDPKTIYHKKGWWGIYDWIGSK